MKRLILLLLVAFVFACSADDDTGTQPVVPDDAREQLAADGKADEENEVAEVLCLSHRLKAGCDVCAVMEWYGDGICDSFCQTPDEDCASDAFVMHLVQPNFYAKSVDGLELRHGFVPSFDAGEFAEYMQVFDAEVRGCSDRDYARSKEDAVEMYRNFVADQQPYEGVRDWQLGQIEKNIVEAEPLDVFASVPSTSEAACNYRDFYAVADDGTVTHYEFDSRAEPAPASPQDILMPSSEAIELYEAMNEYGWNGASAPGVWGSEAEDYSRLAQWVTDADAERGCEDRVHSADTTEALKMYRAFDEGEYGIVNWAGDSPEVVSDAELFRATIEDESNQAVFASEHPIDGTDRPESCFYWDFYILREGGDVLRFRVDITD